MKPYTVTKLNHDTYMIAEVYHLPAALPMYLVIGSERASLVDTGMGIGDLRGTVEEITRLPVAVYNTHAHIDHIAANMQFDEVYMHPAEEAVARHVQPKAQRLEFIELKCMYDPVAEGLLEFARRHIAEYEPDYPVKHIVDGDSVDLGGVSLDVMSVPGHTQGSLVFIDRKNKAAYCGDSVNPRIGIRLSLTKYAHALDRMLAATDDIESYYTGHRLFPFSRQDVRDLLTCAREIIDGAPGEPYPAIFSRKGPQWAWIHWHNGKRIVYDKANIL